MGIDAMKRENMKRKKGSLTVEAVISMTVFISAMFLLLTMVKLVLFMTILNNATAETAKAIATAAYPLSYLNAAQEGIEAKAESIRPQNLQSTLSGSGEKNLIVDLMCGDEMMSSDIVGTISSFVNGALDKTEIAAYELKGAAVNYLCGQIIKGYVEECGLSIDEEKIVLRAVKIPETDTEYSTMHTEPLLLSESGTLTARPSSAADGTDGQFGAKDVLICLEYDYEMALPFLPSASVTLRSTAVERAWLYGTAVGPSRKEGININNLLFGDSKVVYIATGGYGECYHKSGCQHLWTSQTCVTLEYATQTLGLRPCKTCKPS